MTRVMTMDDGGAPVGVSLSSVVTAQLVWLSGIGRGVCCGCCREGSGE